MEMTNLTPIQPKDLIKEADQLIGSIIDKFNLAMIPPDQIQKDCDKLGILCKKANSESVSIDLEPLFALLKKRSGLIAEYVFSILEDEVKAQENPISFIKAMLSSRDISLAKRALGDAISLANDGRLKVSYKIVQFIAGLLETDKSPFNESEQIINVASLIKLYKPGKNFSQKDPFLALYLEDDNLDIRRLAAKILDSTEKGNSHEVMALVLGEDIASFFKPYLVYTDATHIDLLGFHQESLVLLKSEFIQAKKIIGENLLNEVISTVGWNRLNLGLQAKALAGIPIGNSPPYIVSALEAPILKECKGAKEATKLFSIVTCGGLVSDENTHKYENDPITRFRAYNLNHASLLSDFLDVGPLSVDKVLDMLRRMDMIVKDYAALFNHISDECAILPEIYEDIKSKILAELDEDEDKPQFSAELTRIVQSFEEPRSVGDVRTLHGLKRYLHQQGLSMGFKLVKGGRSPNRTVDIVIATEDGVQSVYDKISFADFESDKEDQSQKIPFTVQLLIDGFVRQLLHGQEKFPRVNIFCYGNEVHYYFGFRNHPAFLRIDYAPPLRGGMIDLEYFGVSSYELDQHPNISLDAIRYFFQQMEFEIQIDAVRIHARYDKERALTLGDLCQKAQLVFRLAPYFMDLDWIIGSLALEKEAKQKVAVAWTDFFLRWGFLPLKDSLTENRLGILKGYTNDPTGRQEKVWSGEGDYTDLYTGSPPDGFYKNILRIIHEQGLGLEVPVGKESKTKLGQIELEDWVLVPLRQAIDRGELLETSNGFQLQSSNLFTRTHETEVFAELLASGLDIMSSGIATARLVRPLERSIKFSTTGGVNGYEVQRAVLTLRGEEVYFYVLRGEKDMIRLAFFIRDHVIYKNRNDTSRAWISNVSYDATELAGLLRANDFIDTFYNKSNTNDHEKAGKFLAEINQSPLPPGKAPLRGDRIVTGLKASPGNSVGKALFGTEGRSPQDFIGSILVSTSIQPEDTTFLYYADGIISTGGGILSHAGLIAMQFRKPALIISGTWMTDSNGRKFLSCNSIDYKIIQKKVNGFNICIRTDIQAKKYNLQEGDLLILDTRAGNLRVLGQEHSVLSLYEGFRLYNSANKKLATVKNEKEILNLRGKQLRARYQLENVLRRCNDPVTARYAIFEILLNGHIAGAEMSYRDKCTLLSVLLKNQLLAKDVTDYLMETIVELKSSFTDAEHKSRNDMPTSEYAFEILFLRLDVIHQLQAVESASSALVACNLKTTENAEFSRGSIDSLAIDRLSVLRQKLQNTIGQILERGDDDFLLRHLLRQLDRINSILPISRKEDMAIGNIKELILRRDNKKREKYADRLIIKSSECGFEQYNYIGWKAANLAEIERLSSEKLVPSWFVVTDKAFMEMMDTPLSGIDSGNSRQFEPGISLRGAIASILGRDDLENRQKSNKIRSLWEHIKLPEELCQAVVVAYRNIIGESETQASADKNGIPIYVAVRSSSLEEDTEAAAHAGEFETYLYIHGNDQLLYYLKRTWSGLWTERAIHNRALLGGEENLNGGGVIVQRMVDSRVSGVLQTVNIPKGNIREMVINAGLGLGEGVVSGTVAADQVTVTKGVDPEKELLRFSYITSDKTWQITYNQHAGFGTIRSKTLYHQRLRPAMEYVELCHLVRNAAALEKAYGYPLDIEFGIEGDHLWILQARPVASFISVINETIDRYPLKESDINYNTK